MTTLKRRKIKRIKPEVIVKRRRFIIILSVFIVILFVNIVINFINWIQPHHQNSAVISAALNQEKITVNKSLNQMINNMGNDQKNLLIPEQFQGQVIRSIQPHNERKLVALTFDDGPWGNTTLQVLEILRKNDIKATFFWIGKHLKKEPDIAQKIVEEGHAIANHTWTHRYNKMTAETAKKEIDDTEVLIEQITGIKYVLFRPPGGILTNGLSSYAQQQKYAVMMWSVDSRDSINPRISKEKIIHNVLKNVQPGGIVLLHDGGGHHENTVKALPEIIASLKEQGYEFVTIAQLLSQS
jgi:peptidoglycan/xylan/chitin deacetylase (PgdA/CDA1 family)